MATYHGITRFDCASCEWSTSDDYQLEVVNDILSACLHCDTEASPGDFTTTDTAVR